MIVVPIANQAGSAGKTSTAVTLAALLTERGAEVLLIDLDAQANATFWLAGDTPDGPSAGDVLLRRADAADAIRPTGVDRLHLLPAAGSLDNDAVELTRVVGPEQRLRLALQTVPGLQVVLIDCPGALSVLTVAALVAATGPVLTVAQPTVKELAGLPRLEQTIDDVRDAYNPKLALGAVVPCIVPAAGALYAEALDLLRTNYGELVTPTVRRSVRVPEAYSQQTPLPLHAPREAVTEDYRQVLDHLTARGILT